MTVESRRRSRNLFSNKMAVTMGLFWISLVLSVIGSNASGEFSVLSSPESLTFSGSSRALESLLKEIFSATLGLSVEESSDWDGLLIKDPFNTPEAAVVVYVEGVPSLGNAVGLSSQNFPLIVDEYQPDTYEALRHRIKQRFTNGGNNLVNINLSDTDELTSYSGVFGDIKPPKVTKQSLQHLKASVEEDYQFLSELEALKAITNRVQSRAVSADNIVDFYYFRFRSLHALSDFHGPNSLEAKEAKKLLGKALEDLSNAFVKAYDGSVLVTAVATDVVHTRRAVRSVSSDDEKQIDSNKPTNEFEATSGGAPQTEESQNVTPGVTPDKGNKAEGASSTAAHKDDGYSADYAAIFNIMLWFGVVFTFTLIAIVYAMMDMDPGRDSIIYRMTSTRMKKDN